MSFTAETTTVSAIAMVSAASYNTITATGESSTDRSTDSNTPPSTQEYLLSTENTEEYSTILIYTYVLFIVLIYYILLFQLHVIITGMSPVTTTLWTNKSR